VRKNAGTYFNLFPLSSIGKSHRKRFEANRECNTDCLLQTVSISINATPMIDFSSVSDCPLNSACVKYHTGGTNPSASVKAVIAAHLPEDSACGE